jgi:hypothetical protein
VCSKEENQKYLPFLIDNYFIPKSNIMKVIFYTQKLAGQSIYMAGIHQEKTPIDKMLLLSSKLLTSVPSGDTTLNLYDKNIYGKFQVGLPNPNLKNLIGILSVGAENLHRVAQCTQNGFVFY